MQRLVEAIQREGVYLGNGIIKVDGFINHQLQPDLSLEMGQAFAQHFADAGVDGITKIVTAEVSGITPAVATGAAMGLPVVYARKKRPLTMGADIYEATAPSRTKGGVVNLMISSQFLDPDDRILLIDDFLATGLTISALVNLIEQSGGTLCGIGCVIEKSFEPGRATLSKFNVPIVSLAQIDLDGDNLVVSGALRT